MENVETKNSGIIYKVTNIVNNKVYIGQTIKDLEKRKYYHFYSCFNESDRNYNCKFYKSIRKYGIENFIWEIVEHNINQDILAKKEIEWIEKLDSFRNGLNSTIGGIAPMLGKKHTEESKIKKSKSSLGQKAWNKGIPHSEEAKIKMSKNSSHRILSEQEKQKISKRMKENNPMKNPAVVEKVQKIRNENGICKGTNHPMYGKKFSDESRQKMSESHKKINKQRDKNGRYTKKTESL